MPITALPGHDGEPPSGGCAGALGGRLVHTRRAWLGQALANAVWGPGLAAGLSVGWSVPAGAVPAVGEPVRWPRVQLIDGRPWDADQAAGQVIVVVFFSTTCPYCVRHNQRMTQLAERHGGRGLRVLGVAQDGDAERVRQHMQAMGHRFEVTIDARPMQAALVTRRLVPYTVVVDARGRLRESIPGELSEDDVMALARWIQRGAG